MECSRILQYTYSTLTFPSCSRRQACASASQTTAVLFTLKRVWILQQSSFLPGGCCVSGQCTALSLFGTPFLGERKCYSLFPLGLHFRDIIQRRKSVSSENCLFSEAGWDSSLSWTSTPLCIHFLITIRAEPNLSI